MLQKGLIEIYTGDGKGKTTAALGLAVRAAGRGNNVLIYQFLKPSDLELGERIALELELSRITIQASDIPWNMSKSLNAPEVLTKNKTAIHDVLIEIAQAAKKKVYDVLILDEIVFCISKGIAELDDIKNIINKKDPAVEIILTGRGATKELIELADLVTEMKKIKHPFDNKIHARKGIEY